MKLYIIDSIGAFVDEDKPPYNWSKAPLEDVEDIDKIVARFDVYLEKVKSLGYNAISIDDLAHMVELPMYSSSTKKYLKRFSCLYKAILKTAKAKELKVFVNFDLMFFNKEIDDYVKSNDKRIINILDGLISKLFTDFAVDGVISRFGESDGLDVKSEFKSRMIIKKPAQLKKYINNLMPVFEKYNKLWIFRTWTLGAYKIGDLMWNKKSFLKVFSTITSDHLVISMKYGNGDFFRGLELNPLFLLGEWRFIVELQTRREYDGFGELPFYTGWDYWHYLSQLKSMDNFCGVSVWCNTGGWGNSHRATFLDNSSKWVELNTKAVVDSLASKDPDTSIREYFRDERMINFLKLYNRLSYEIMYPSSKTERFYRRLKIPPITWIFWGNVSANSLISTYHRVVYRRIKKTKPSDIEVLRQNGKDLKIEDIDFICDTLLILLECRNYIYFGGDIGSIRQSIDKYVGVYPDFLKFKISAIKNSKITNLFIRSILRQKSSYRLVDKVVFNRLYAAWLIRLAFKFYSKKLPDFVNENAMPLNTFNK